MLLCFFFFFQAGDGIRDGRFFFQAEDGIRDGRVTGVQTCALPIYFIQPHYFRTQTVEFRIGSELRALNLLLSAVRRIRQVLGISLRWLIPIGRALIHVSALLGSTAGGVMVEISGYSGNERLSETWCV